MSRTERFRNRLADRYSRRPVPDEAVHQEKLRVTREQLLDTLRNRIHHRARMAARPPGWHPSLRAARQARENGR